MRARLAIGTHDSFMKAKEAAYRADLDAKWTTRFGMQAYFHSAAAHYWQSKVNLETAEITGQNYGVVVRARMLFHCSFCVSN